jgi:hypothetical protein
MHSLTLTLSRDDVAVSRIKFVVDGIGVAVITVHGRGRRCRTAAAAAAAAARGNGLRRL